MPILIVARAMPMVRMNRPIRSSVFLLGEHMLDTRAEFRFGIIGPPNGLWHGATLLLLAMDVADEAVPDQECLVGRRSVGGIGPDSARRIALIKKALTQTARGRPS